MSVKDIRPVGLGDLLATDRAAAPRPRRRRPLRRITEEAAAAAAPPDRPDHRPGLRRQEGRPPQRRPAVARRRIRGPGGGRPGKHRRVPDRRGTAGTRRPPRRGRDRHCPRRRRAGGPPALQQRGTDPRRGRRRNSGGQRHRARGGPAHPGRRRRPSRFHAHGRRQADRPGGLGGARQGPPGRKRSCAAASAQLVARETDRLAALRSRPVLAAPEGMVTARAEEVERLSRRSTAAISAAVTRAADQLVHLQAQVRALSPQQTLDRGYAVVQLAGGNGASPGTVVRHPSQAPPATELSVRVAGGRFGATSTGTRQPASA